jgi:hypothetical protein
LTPTQRLPGRPCDAYEWFIGNISDGLQWDFSHPQEVEDAHGSTEWEDWEEKKKT